MERYIEEKRERFLSTDELRRLVKAITQHPNQQSANIVRLLLMTGARRGEVLSATWEQFNLERGTWTKPSGHTKQKRPHVVPLSAPALALLGSMAHEANKADYLFPSRKDAPQASLKRFWRSVCATAKLDDVRVHDLRHSFASYLASSGASLPLIGDMLGHTQPSTTARYAHLLDDPRRKAANTVGAIISAAETDNSGAEVVTISKKGRRGART
jgi:integrase